MEEHQKQRCPCGNDFTEEERQQTRARLLREKESAKVLGQVTKSTNWRRQEAYQPKKQTQEDNSQLNDEQKKSQLQQVLAQMENLSQYMNAPYSQHPMKPATSHPVTSYPATSHPVTSYPATSHPVTSYPATPYPVTAYPATSFSVASYPVTSYPVLSHQSPQSFHPYFPHHAFTGLGAYPEEDYSRTSTVHPNIYSTSYDTGPVTGFEEPFVGTQESPIAGISNLYLAEDQPFQEIRDESQDLPFSEEMSSHHTMLDSIPAFFSSDIISPSRPGSCPNFESKSDWDTISR